MTIRKIYTNIFFTFGITYALVWSLLDYASGVPFSLWKVLFSTVFIGGFVSYILVSRMKKKFAKIGKEEISSEDLEMAHSKTVMSTLSPEQLLLNLNGNTDFKLAKFSHNQKEIDLNVGLNKWTWAEKLNINSKPISDGTYEYEITSEARTNTVLRDYTKKFEFVRKVEELLSNSV